MPHEAIKKSGKDFGRNPVGTGAFKFSSWKANEAIIVDKNSNYWDGEAKSDAIISLIKVGQELLKCLSGGLDIG